MLYEVFGDGEAMRRVKVEGTEADNESETICVGWPFSIVAGCESQGVTFEETVRRAGFVLEIDTVWRRIVHRYVSSQTSE